MTEAINAARDPYDGTRDPYHGALFLPTRKFAEVATCVKDELKECFPKSTFKIIRRIQSLGRSLEIQIIDHDEDLEDVNTRRSLDQRITSIAQQYGYDRSLYEVDLLDRHFSISISIHPDYRARRQSMADPKPF